MRTEEGNAVASRHPKYYLVEASVLPEVFAKVVEAKEQIGRAHV